MQNVLNSVEDFVFSPVFKPHSNEFFNSNKRCQYWIFLCTLHWPLWSVAFVNGLKSMLKNWCNWKPVLLCRFKNVSECAVLKKKKKISHQISNLIKMQIVAEINNCIYRKVWLNIFECINYNKFEVEKHCLIWLLS